MSVKLAIFYYSSTGTNHQLAKWAAEAAQEAGAEVRIRKVQELAPESAIEQNPAWKAHHEATKNEPVASLEDLEWADAYIFSVPTRFGNVPSQMKQFLDTAGGLWAEGKLANKVVSAMSSASNSALAACRCSRASDASVRKWSNRSSASSSRLSASSGR